MLKKTYNSQISAKGIPLGKFKVLKIVYFRH